MVEKAVSVTCASTQLFEEGDDVSRHGLALGVPEDTLDAGVPWCSLVHLFVLVFGLLCLALALRNLLRKARVKHRELACVVDEAMETLHICATGKSLE